MDHAATSKNKVLDTARHFRQVKAYLIALGNLSEETPYRSYTPDNEWLCPTITESGAVPTKFVVYYSGRNNRAVLKALSRLEAAGLVEREVFRDGRNLGYAWRLTTDGKQARGIVLETFSDGYDESGRNALGFDREGYDIAGINFDGYDADGTHKGFQHLQIAQRK